MENNLSLVMLELYIDKKILATSPKISYLSFCTFHHTKGSEVTDGIRSHLYIISSSLTYFSNYLTLSKDIEFESSLK